MRTLSIENYCICLIDIVNYSTWCVGKSSLEVRDFLLHFRTQVDQVLPDGVYKIEDKGDELLLISKDVDLMASTVFAIIDLGTPVRVGVHYGQICYDESRCFGSDINITSRLQTSSLPGNVINVSRAAFAKMKCSADYSVGRTHESYFKGVGTQSHLFLWKKQTEITLFGHPDDAARLKGNVYSSVEIIPTDVDRCMEILKELREFEMYYRNTFQAVYSKDRILKPLCSGTCQGDLFYKDYDTQRHEYNIVLRKRRSSEFVF